MEDQSPPFTLSPQARENATRLEQLVREELDRQVLSGDTNEQRDGLPTDPTSFLGVIRAETPVDRGR